MRQLDRITGGDEDALRTWLLPRLAGASVAGLRTGFLTVLGAEMLRPSLERMLEGGGRLFVVAGGHPDQTEPGALAILAELGTAYPGLVTATLAPPEPGWQNAKTYYLQAADGSREVYIGSANLTRGGLEANHEAGIVLDSRVEGEEAVGQVLARIRAWEELPGARRVTTELVAGFAEQARPWRASRARRQAPADPALPLSAMLSAMLPDALIHLEAAGVSGEVTGVPTGFADLDALTNGLQPGTLTVIGGRPSVGKSVLLLDICRAAAVARGVPVAFFSLETPAREVNLRLLAAEAGVSLYHMRTGMMSDDDWTRIAARMAELAPVPFYVCDSAGLSAQALCAEAERLAAESGIGLIAADHLQLITPDVRSDTREREVAEITRQLMELARVRQVPVVITAQLNRGPEQRTDKRPILDDLRESGAIAQVADLVILLYREDAYERETPRAGEADLIIAKNKHGPTTTITVEFQKKYPRFRDLARHD